MNWMSSVPRFQKDSIKIIPYTNLIKVFFSASVFHHSFIHSIQSVSHSLEKNKFHSQTILEIQFSFHSFWFPSGKFVYISSFHYPSQWWMSYVSCQRNPIFSFFLLLLFRNLTANYVLKRQKTSNEWNSFNYFPFSHLPVLLVVYW